MTQVHDLTTLTEDGEMLTYNSLMNKDDREKLTSERFEDIYKNVIERMDKAVTAWKKERKERLRNGQVMNNYYNDVKDDEVLIQSNENMEYIISKVGVEPLKVPTYKQLISSYPEFKDDNQLQTVIKNKETIRNR
ncbi:hypothetical protein [Fructobacillus papyrifericola]|uniref:Uncharacterized protein n=1 Tax=Fructobacillus papyrifericola TaxID=2713172 RepID=A0ABS5QTB2_9LACO|nr:hypothetical protein [Fructobacillus papyrifericola]MBS9336438.1 hypothetical protein [Fructobacillus papyrifericola]